VTLRLTLRAKDARRIFPMAKKLHMYDFVYGGCWMQRGTAEFVTVWLETNGNPCSVCRKNKSNCGFFMQLMVLGDSGEKENLS
jgi:hypothetical protein